MEDEKALSQLQDVFRGVGDEVPVLSRIDEALAAPLRRRRLLVYSRLLSARGSRLVEHCRGRAAVNPSGATISTKSSLLVQDLINVLLAHELEPRDGGHRQGRGLPSFSKASTSLR